VTDVINNEQAVVVDLDAAQPQAGVASDELVRAAGRAGPRRGVAADR
jgi:hypothetical protein